MRPRIRREDRLRWVPGCFINDYGHPVAIIDSVQAYIVTWADALTYNSMRK